MRTARPPAIGRFELLKAGGGGLVFKASGCLGSLTRVIPCPPGVATPIPDAPVPRPPTTTPAPVGPTTTIVGGPSGTVTALPVSFTYTADSTAATFECNLDGGGWAACPGGGLSYAAIAPGSHTFQVRAVVGGLVDPAPAQRTWTQAAPAPPAKYFETAGGSLNTWTNYSNAGGTQGPSVPAAATVEIACKLPGFRVSDGNTWWYRLAPPPWNGAYYASADGFYNNGQTSGPLHGTPFFDPSVPDC